ncbi:MAG: hypothetical protein L6Q92_16725 [Phycisphaerae bacterium]|nr:hypothetical protein [Phycisphaerae bacterium]
MNPDVIDAFALVGLRALADHDPAEFRRSTDFSKRQLDEKIDAAIERLRGSDSQHYLRELQSRIDELRAIEHDAEGHAELGYLLRQVGTSCIQRAQQLAISYSRRSTPRIREESNFAGVSSVRAHDPVTRSQEFERLAVMRLLRDFPEYKPKFNYRIKSLEIDCVLEPLSEGCPALLVEAKVNIRSMTEIQSAFAQIRRMLTQWGKGSLGVLVLPNTRDWRHFAAERPIGHRAFVLTYDSEKNEFLDDGLRNLMAAVRGEFPNSSRN